MTLTVLPVRLMLDVTDPPYAGKGTGERSLVIKILDRLVHKRFLFLLDAGIYSLNHLDIPRCNKEYGGAASIKLHSRVLMVEVHFARAGSENRPVYPVKA